jgi:hypothetical protein
MLGIDSILDDKDSHGNLLILKNLPLYNTKAIFKWFHSNVVK